MIAPITAETEGFSLRQAANISGLSTHMLNYLCRHKMVEPTAGARRGRGNRRLYAFSDLLLLRVIERLLAQGVSPLRLRYAVSGIQSKGGSTSELMSRRFIVTDGVDIFFEDDGVIELLASGQLAFAFVLQLDSLRQETRAVIDGAAKAA